MTIYRTWQAADDYDASRFKAWYLDLLECYKRERNFLKNCNFFSTGTMQIRKYLMAANLTGIDNVYRSLVLDAMMSSESIPGSDVWVPIGLSDRFIVTAQGYDSSENYISYVEKYSYDTQTIGIFRNVLDLCGPLTKISVRLGEYKEPFIRYKKSFNFPIHPCSRFIQTVGKHKDLVLDNPEVFFIEGAPATLSEIEAILYRSVESKRPIAIVARHFPEEISATLGTNWKNGKLNIIPLVYGSDIQTINLSADMIAVCGGELVSTAFGDIITSAVQLDEKYGSVSRIEYNGNSLDIESDRSVERQRAILLQALKDAPAELEEILSNRIHSLTNDAIEVNIPKSSSKLREELDMMFKHYSQFVQSGYSKTQHGILPTSIVNNVNVICESTRVELKKIGGFLLEK